MVKASREVKYKVNRILILFGLYLFSLWLVNQVQRELYLPPHSKVTEVNFIGHLLSTLHPARCFVSMISFHYQQDSARQILFPFYSEKAEAQRGQLACLNSYSQLVMSQHSKLADSKTHFFFPPIQQ